MAHPTLHTKSLFAAICGNFIEWYDFALYLLLAPILSKHFFPLAQERWALVGAFTVYAVSFFFRPIGGILFGQIGDKYGRKIALSWSIMCLTGLSIALSLIPDYSKIGCLSTLLLCLCRIGQGICLGVEFAGSMVYLAESAAPNRRALLSSLSNNGSNFGVMIASISCFGLAHLMGEAVFNAWGFRILFFAGGLVGFIGFSFRANLQESTEYSRCKEINQAPLKSVLKYHRHSLFQLFIIVSLGAVGSYGLMGYVSTFLSQNLSVPLVDALGYETLFISLTLLMVPLFAVIADQITPKKMLRLSCILYIGISIPCFFLVYYLKQPLWLMLLFIVYSLEEASIPSLMREYFPVSVRYTGVSLAYNLSMGLIGGLCPVLIQFLLVYFNCSYAIAYLLMVSSTVVLLVLKSRSRVILSDKLVPIAN